MASAVRPPPTGPASSGPYAFQDLVAAELARPPAHDLWLAAILGALAAVVVVLRIFWVL